MADKKYTYERVTFVHEGKWYQFTGKTLKEAYEKSDKKRLELENGIEILKSRCK